MEVEQRREAIKHVKELLAEPVEILVVDDCPVQAELLRYILENQKYLVSIARNGQEALDKLEERRPTLVISDIAMPEMDGFELCRRIKAVDRFKDLPVIILTSLNDLSHVMQGLKCGTDNFISKPYNAEFLLSRIRHVLMNQGLRKTRPHQMGMEIFFDGQKHFIKSDRVQILDLLISTFEGAVEKNKALEEANRELIKARDLLQRQTEELMALSLRDGLTGLYNRRAFMTLAEHQLKVAERTETSLLLMFIDLDDLKAVNDLYGHAMGDRVLVATANILGTVFRQSDLVARLGGDEFVVLYLCSNADAPEAVVERLQKRLRQYNACPKEHPNNLSFSIGFAWYNPGCPVPLEELLQEADDMMYAQKKAKKQGVGYPSPADLATPPPGKGMLH
ncbi:MAG TPA: hypothetical protein DCY27_03255 [Desulfobacterales bacterium]|nr:hypothetical protein [Desulfobacterales bacterium]